MKSKHPLSKLFLFCDSMLSSYDSDIQDRFNLFLDYIEELEDETKIKMYNTMSERIADAVEDVSVLETSDIMGNLPDIWLFPEWFNERRIDILSCYDDPQKKVAVFDYYAILCSLEEADHKRLMMLMVLDVIERTGHKGCRVMMETLRDHIEDKKLLQDYGYNESSKILDAALDIVGSYTPTGSGILSQLVDKYREGDDNMIDLTVEFLTDSNLVSQMGKEITDTSSNILKDKSKITQNLGKLVDAFGGSEDISKLLQDATDQVLSNPEDTGNILYEHFSNVTGIDKDSISRVTENIKNVVPKEELSEITSVITDSIWTGDEQRNA